MMKWSPSNLIPTVVGLAGAAAVAVWLVGGSHASLDTRVPGMDRAAGAAAAERPLTPQLQTFSAECPTAPGAWPCFRNARRDGLADDTTPLARAWPAAGPPKLWSLALGEGYAGAAVLDSRMVVLDYDRQASADALRCFALATGKELWRVSYPVAVKRNHGMSRTVPALSDKYVVSLGPKCHLMCVELASGKPVWEKPIDLAEAFHATVPPWYAGQCPLIEGDRIIVAPGGDCLVAALDIATGKTLWQSPNPHNWVMTHVSVVPMEVAGQKSYVYCGSGGVAAVSAADGKLLWETSDWKISIATVPSPVVLPDGKIFFSGGYNSGALLGQVKADGQKFAFQTLKRFKPAQFGSTQQTPILFDGHLYGVREKDKQLVCMDLDGNVLWESGSQHRFGLGPYLIANGLIYLVDDSCKLTLAEATPKRYQQLAEFQVIDGHDAWGPLSLVNGKLILRDFTQMLCLDVSKK